MSLMVYGLGEVWRAWGRFKLYDSRNPISRAQGFCGATIYLFCAELFPARPVPFFSKEGFELVRLCYLWFGIRGWEFLL